MGPAAAACDLPIPTRPGCRGSGPVRAPLDIGVIGPGHVGPQVVRNGDGSAVPGGRGRGAGSGSGGGNGNPYMPSVDWNQLLGALQNACQGAPFVNPTVPCSQIPPAQPAGATGPPPPPPSIVLALSAFGQLTMPSPVPSHYPYGDAEGERSPVHAGQREHLVLDGPGDLAAGVQDGVGGCGVGQGHGHPGQP